MQSQINDLLDLMYSANVIPGNYRDLYAAVFLYDYFSQSRADDVDMVLNTYVLEQIKARLDKIMYQLSEVLVDQSITMAVQRSALSEQQRQTALLRQMRQDIRLSREEQNQYLCMIESHTKAMEFFAASRHFRN